MNHESSMPENTGPAILNLQSSIPITVIAPNRGLASLQLRAV